MLNIVLTGANGFVGRNFFYRHKNQGQNIIPVVRKSAQAADLGAKEFILFNELSGSKLIEMNLSSACLIHLIGASRDSKDYSMWDSIVKTTHTIVTAAREASLGRIIYLSGYGVSDQSSEGYFLAKWNAEEIIRCSGIPYTIFRASYILGGGDELSPYLIKGIRKGLIEIPGDGSYRIQPLYIFDVIDILFETAKDQTTKNYMIDLLGSSITFVQYIELLASKLGIKIKISNVDLASIIRQSIFSPNSDFTTSELAVLISDIVGPPTKDCFGVKIKDVEEFIDNVI